MACVKAKSPWSPKAPAVSATIHCLCRTDLPKRLLRSETRPRTGSVTGERPSPNFESSSGWVDRHHPMLVDTPCSTFKLSWRNGTPKSGLIGGLELVAKGAVIAALQAA